MGLHKTDLNLFVVFDVIYTEGNLTKAGHVLGITQPAVSNALSRLRKLFNDPLFIRTGKGMKPTPTAQNIIGQIRQALTILRQSVQQCSLFDPATSDRTFNISMGDFSESLMLTHLFEKLSTEAPGIKIEVHPVNVNTLSNELENGTLDFVIDGPLSNIQDLNHHKIMEDPYVCCLKADHPLAKMKLNLDQYLSLKHIQVSDYAGDSGPIDKALQILGQKRKIGFTTHHLLMGPSLLMNSGLALTVPQRLVQGYEGIRIHKLPFVTDNFSLHLYWHPSVEEDAANVWMREVIFQLFEEQTRQKKVA